MKNFTLFFFLILFSGSLSAQKLGNSFVSPMGGSFSNGQELVIQNIGEPVSHRIDGSQLTMKQGLLYNNREPAPEDNRTRIQVRVFLDENEDGIKDFDEKFIANGSVTVEGQSSYLVSSAEGLSFDATPGDYEFIFNTKPIIWILTTPNLISVSVDEQLPYVSVLFGVAPDDECIIPDLKMASQKFKCFEEIRSRICVMNRGCTAYTDTVYVEIDPRIDSIYFFQKPDVEISDHVVGWVVTVNPGQVVVLTYSHLVPPVEKPEDIGEIYTTRSWIELDNGAVTQEVLNQELKCSYDPNDKLVVPDREDNLALIDEELTYTIRFQNTGNDYADDVLVIDTLSEHLDVSTFELVYTSHPRQLEVVFPEGELNIVHFQFKNIYLPDSTTNEPGSNGQVMFTIDLEEGTSLDTEIENTGYIYFDKNPAIITNTTKSIMVDEYPVLASKDVVGLEREIFFYPNPSSGILYLSEEIDLLKVYDLTGRQVFLGTKLSKIDCSGLNAGTYLIEITDNNKVITEILILTNH